MSWRNSWRKGQLSIAFGALLCLGALMLCLLHMSHYEPGQRHAAASSLQAGNSASMPDTAEGRHRGIYDAWDKLRAKRPKPRSGLGVKHLDLEHLLPMSDHNSHSHQVKCRGKELQTTYDGDYRRACPEDANCTRAQRIPKLLHCSWESDQIPRSYARVMKTFADHHPGWRVVFWSDASIAWFLEENYPTFYFSVFTRYKRPIERVDSFRYFVLYHYGGVYADSDFLFFRSLDPFLHHHAVMPREPEPNALALLTNTRFMASNAIMMTAPRHPLFLDIVLHLQHASPLSDDDYLFTAGPLMVHRLFTAYELRTPCTLQPSRRVYAPPSHYFWPYTRTDFKRRGRDVFVRRWCEKFDGIYNRSDTHLAAMCEDPTDVDALSDIQVKVTPFASHLNKVNYPGMRVETEVVFSGIEKVHPTYVTYADLRGRVPDTCFTGACSHFLTKHRILPYCVPCYDSIL